MRKMNGLFLAAFVPGLVAVACSLGAMAAAYLWKLTDVAVLIGAFGALCAFAAIIFAYRSKPRAPKQKSVDTDSAM
jgi:uncharacterized membrane protein YfcA